MSARPVTRRSLLGLGLACWLALTTLVPAAAEPVARMFPVPTVTVYAGDVLTDRNVAERRLLANEVAMRTHFTDRESVLGKVVRRTIPAGSAIAISALRDAYMFKEGARVSMRIAEKGLVIESQGIALEPGVVGRRVKVRNVDSGVIVTGIVRNDGSIDIGT